MSSYWFLTEILHMTFLEIVALSIVTTILMLGTFAVVVTVLDLIERFITHRRFKKTATYRLLKAKGYYN